MEWVVGIVIAVLISISVTTIAVVGLGVFGITKIVQAVTNRLPSKHKEPKRLGNPPTPRGASVPAGHANAPMQHAHRAAASSVRMRSYEYLDVDSGATPQKIIEVMRAYEHNRVTGFYAREIIDVLEMSDLQRKSLFSELDSKFSKKSITWDHFATTASEALDAILRNCALLANRVQAFDVEDYERMEHFYTTGGEMRNGKQDPARIKRWELLRETKAEMDELRSANEALLLELKKLSAALARLSSNESTDESARIAQEVSRLAEETKYYE